MAVANQFIRSGQVKTALVVGAETLSRLTDWSDRSNCILWGDGAGAVILTRQYDAWGNLELGAAESGYAFTAREWDSETGLNYYRARYYAPDVGRFISEDPIRFKAGVNFFAYVLNNPVLYGDPTGLEGCCRKVKIWICERRLDRWYAAILPTHMYVCCDGPNMNCYGHQRNNLKRGDPIPREGNPTGTCREVEVCEDEKQKKCNNPTSPCDADTFGWNCRDWATWDGKRPCPDPYSDFNGHGGVK
jgi:RHS repeat-associated protein